LRNETLPFEVIANEYSVHYRMVSSFSLDPSSAKEIPGPEVHRASIGHLLDIANWAVLRGYIRSPAVTLFLSSARPPSSVKTMTTRLSRRSLFSGALIVAPASRSWRTGLLSSGRSLGLRRPQNSGRGSRFCRARDQCLPWRRTMTKRPFLTELPVFRKD